MAGSLMLDIQGLELTKEDSDLLSKSVVGGIILFARNYRDRNQLCRLVEQIRTLRPDLIIAVDQEGGRVQRFREDFLKLPALQKIGDLARREPKKSKDICFSMGWLMATEVLSVGVDLSFAPVLDLDRNSCSVISDRSFSEDPVEAVQMARAYIAGMREAGMASTAKHFPGHGKVAGDSHLELPVDQRDLGQVRSCDLIPFAELSAEYDAVMPGHLSFPKIDGLPVGFSPFWLQQVLRTELGFNGVIFSDDLSMQGAAEMGSYSGRAKLALEAGCDMILVCNDRAGANEVVDYLDEITIHSLAERARRVSVMKARKSWNMDEILASKIYTRATEYLSFIES